MARPVFLAAPDAGQAATGLVDKILLELQIATDGGLMPSHVWNAHVVLGDPGVDVKPEEHFTRTLTALAEATVVVAVVDGPQVDETVAILVGYAFAARKPIVAYSTDRRPKSALLEGAVSEWVHDVRSLAATLRAFL